MDNAFYTAIEVTTVQSATAFIAFPKTLYQNDGNWICPLDAEVNAVFDPAKNSFFTHGRCTRWLLQNEKKNTVGRIAAFINDKKNSVTKAPAGGIGFFECINDLNAAVTLFNVAKQWLQAHGMTVMDGPVNFGENDKYWGLLIEGFKPPSFGMNYNPPYYKTFFEAYGFVKMYDQFTNVLDATVPLSERFTRISDWVMQKEGYSFAHFSKKEREKYFHDFQKVYNDAWQNFENFTPIDLATIRESFRQMQAIMDEKIIWFAYYKKEPVAFVLCLPDVNQVLKHFKGNLHLLNKLRFLWYKKTKTISRLRIIILGCKTDFQNHGIESALIRCLQDEVLPRGNVREVELAWVGDFNSKMLAIHKAAGAHKEKVHRTYRYTF